MKGAFKIIAVVFFGLLGWALFMSDPYYDECNVGDTFGYTYQGPFVKITETNTSGGFNGVVVKKDVDTGRFVEHPELTVGDQRVTDDNGNSNFYKVEVLSSSPPSFECHELATKVARGPKSSKSLFQTLFEER